MARWLLVAIQVSGKVIYVYIYLARLSRAVGSLLCLRSDHTCMHLIESVFGTHRNESSAAGYRGVLIKKAGGSKVQNSNQVVAWWPGYMVYDKQAHMFPEAPLLPAPRHSSAPPPPLSCLALSPDMSTCSYRYIAPNQSQSHVLSHPATRNLPTGIQQANHPRTNSHYGVGNSACRSPPTHILTHLHSIPLADTGIHPAILGSLDPWRWPQGHRLWSVSTDNTRAG